LPYPSHSSPASFSIRYPFLLLLRPPPRPTLFPYTTLFRSIGLRAISTGTYVTPTTVIANLVNTEELKITFSVPEKYASRIQVGTDRKSTRLNSSHVKISYAVFCLKKKKNNRIHIGYGELSD